MRILASRPTGYRVRGLSAVSACSTTLATSSGGIASAVALAAWARIAAITFP